MQWSSLQTKRFLLYLSNQHVWQFLVNPGSEEHLLIWKKALQNKLGQASRAGKEINWLLSSQKNQKKKNPSELGFQDSGTAHLQPEIKREELKLK